MKQIISFILFASVLCFASTGCKKTDSTPNNNNNNNNNPVTPVDSGKVSFHIHTYIGEEEVDGYNIAYTLDDGRKISLNRAQFYISGIQLVKSDGTLYSIQDKILLKVLEEESYIVATVPAGTYKAVKFKIGLDAATNAKDATGNDLLDHPEMWFGSSAQPDGYIYLNAQGKIDTTTDASGTAAEMQPFIYKIGTDAHYVQVTMPDHAPNFTITKDGTEFVHMLFDYSKIFSGVSINNAANLMVNSKADNSTAISTAIANNIPGAFRYEE